MKCGLILSSKARFRGCTLAVLALFSWAVPGRLIADADVYLVDVPDYDWQFGCFGTATGNLFGFWDRNGLTNFYTGPTGGGLAPLSRSGGNEGIRSMWASQAGFDGRPANKYGHVDDYWSDYQATGSDPYASAGRAEHAPDCIGDFIGLNQKKWTMMNAECDGNIDGYSFVYWDAAGNKRINYTPPPDAGMPPRDIQSGLRAWSEFRGYDADVFTQLVDFNPATPPGGGFTFEDLKREINAGYPVLIFLQQYGVYSRNIGGMPTANPEIHGMLVYGYREDALGGIARIRTSWASGDFSFLTWDTYPFTGNLSVRGVIGYHPKPKITRVGRGPTKISISWEGPSARLHDALSGVTTDVHYYVLEKATTLSPPDFQPVTDPITTHSVTVLDNSTSMAFYRVRIVPAP